MKSHVNKKRRLNKLGRLTVTLSVCLILVIVATTTALALRESKKNVNNTFGIKTMEVQLKEEFNPPAKWDKEIITKKITLENSGGKNVFIRVQTVENWTSKSGTILSTTFVDDNGVTKDVVQKNWANPTGLNNTTSWVFKDGWYYYTKVLTPNSQLPILESIQMANDLKKAASYVDANYELSLFHEAVSVEDVKELWGVEPTIQNDNVNWSF